MSSSVARVPGRGRSWIEPALWLGIPALFALGPWAAREWAAARAPHLPARRAVIVLTGDRGRDARAFLERAWADTRLPPRWGEASPEVREHLARRRAEWLAAIAEAMRPLDAGEASRVADEAIRRLGVLPERWGPEELAAPLETPAGELLHIARGFQALPALSHRAVRAAWTQAREAGSPGAEVAAFCLIARETAPFEPATARAALGEARRRAERLSGNSRPDALAALAGCLAVTASPEAARAMATRAIRALGSDSHDPECVAVAAALLAPAVPEAAGRLAAQAVDQASRATSMPPDQTEPHPVDWFSPRLPGRPLFGLPSMRGAGGPAPRRAPRSATGEASALRAPERSGQRDGSPGLAADAHLRRVAALLAPSHPAAAERAAGRIRQPGDRSGALAEVAALIEAREPSRAVALYRRALQAADQIQRPAAARRAARLRAATGLAAFDASAALAVIEPLPPRLIAFQLNDFAARLASRDPEAALRVIERGEESIQTGQGPAWGLFAAARAAVAARLADRNPRRAAALVASFQSRRSVDACLTFARGLAGDGRP